MAANRILYLASLAGALVFHMYYTEWFSWFLLILLAVLPFFSLAVSLPALLTARLHLRGPAKALMGETAHARLYLTAKLPAGRCYVRLAAPAGEKKRRKKKLPLSVGEKVLLPISTAHCTCQKTGLARARVLDYLGLFSFPLRLPEPVVTEIYPAPLAPEPLPDVTNLLSPPLRPKAGGGFSEIHELRDYHPGDAMRDVHWKLSAKSDSLIVREAQEEIRTQAVLSLRLEGPGSSADSSLAQLCFLSPWLLEKGISHTVLCACGPEESITASITEAEDLDALLSRLIRRLPGLRPWEDVPAPRPACGGWLYSIISQAEEAGQ